MKNFFLILIFLSFTSSFAFAEYKLEPTNCTKKKKENCGAYLYNTKTGSTFFCTSEKCTEIQEALEEYVVETKGSTEKKESKKSKIPKFDKKKKKKSKIPKFKKSN